MWSSSWVSVCNTILCVRLPQRFSLLLWAAPSWALLASFSSVNAAKLICTSWAQTLGKRRDSGKALSRWHKGFPHSLWVILLPQEVLYPMKRGLDISLSITTRAKQFVCACRWDNMELMVVARFSFKMQGLAAVKLSLYPKQTPSLLFSSWGNAVWKIVWGSLFSKLGWQVLLELLTSHRNNVFKGSLTSRAGAAISAALHNSSVCDWWFQSHEKHLEI